mgnify:CR=1 FL=1
MEIIIIIPALEKNQYSQKGDLVEWGSTSLLEWKLAQAKKVKYCKNIYVSTNSKKINDLCKENQIQVIKRKKKVKNLYQLHKSVALKFPNKFILWLNPTSPFISSNKINKFIEKFKKNYKKFDSAIMSLEQKEYFFINNKAINFSLDNQSTERKNVSKIKQIVNAAYLIRSDKILKYKNLFGKKIYFYNVDWLSSLEIKSSKDINLFKTLIDKYISIENK